MIDNRYKDYSYFFCICCGDKISRVDNYDDVDDFNTSISDKTKQLESGMYDSGVVDVIAAGYGSEHDGDVYYVAVCDCCTTKALTDGRLAYKFNYMDQKPL